MITIRRSENRWVCEGYTAIQIGEQHETKKITAYGHDAFEAFDNYAVAYKAYLTSIGLTRAEPPHY